MIVRTGFYIYIVKFSLSTQFVWQVQEGEGNIVYVDLILMFFFFDYSNKYTAPGF